MFLFKAPHGLLDILGKIRRQFKTIKNQKFIRLIGKKLLLPKNDGGLGVNTLKKQNIPFLTKLWWKL